MNAVTSMPLVRRTLATLRSAELGFFGVCVLTMMHTPRLWGEPIPLCVRFFSALKLYLSAGALFFFFLVRLGFRTSWFTVGTASPLQDIRVGDKREHATRGGDKHQ
jgi:hypothetical protein